jgi:predicted transposase YdaD
VYLCGIKIEFMEHIQSIITIDKSQFELPSINILKSHFSQKIASFLNESDLVMFSDEEFTHANKYEIRSSLLVMKHEDLEEALRLIDLIKFVLPENLKIEAIRLKSLLTPRK